MPKRKKIYIDRSKWRTGQMELRHLEAGQHATGKGDTRLINPQGYKCCLGFVCQQAGPRQKLTDKFDPKNLGEPVPGLSFRDVDDMQLTKLSKQAINVNDDEMTTAKQKKQKLRSLFKDSPYQLVFEGEYTVPKGAKS